MRSCFAQSVEISEREPRARTVVIEQYKSSSLLVNFILKLVYSESCSLYFSYCNCSCLRLFQSQTLTLRGRQKHGDSAYISASFRSLQGDTIAIFSTPRSLSVSTLDGENLVRFSKLGQPAAQYFFGEGEEDKVVFQLLQDGYVEKNKRI